MAVADPIVGLNLENSEPILFLARVTHHWIMVILYSHGQLKAGFKTPTTREKCSYEDHSEILDPST